MTTTDPRALAGDLSLPAAFARIVWWETRMAHRRQLMLAASILSVVFLASATSTHAQSRPGRIVTPEEQARWRTVIEASGTLPFLTGLTWHERGYYGEVKDIKAFTAYLQSRLRIGTEGIFRRGILHSRHKDIGPKRLDFRSDRGSLGSGSLQVVFSRLTGVVFIDMDEFNPYEDVASFFGHAREVCLNRMRARKQ